VWLPGYPSPPASGYYILLPDQAEQMEDSDARVTALTNLPDGTLLDISTTKRRTSNSCKATISRLRWAR
jgi:hypothetical protein